jgi:hypothetical protein
MNNSQEMTQLQWGATPVLVPYGKLGLSDTEASSSGDLLQRVKILQKDQEGFNERWLQRLIHQSPSCLPFSEIDPNLNPFSSVCMEMPTPKGFIDNLLITASGDIALIETKLFRNPEARRQVLAQILDYATSIFEMNYETFAENALKGDRYQLPKINNLQDAILTNADRLDEAQFIDNVSRNLKSGRALLIIAGDGIRNETEQLLAGMQSYSRFSFTFALVEMAIYKLPNLPSFLVHPRTLAKTEIVKRTVVEIVGGAAVVREQKISIPETIGTLNYWDELEKRTPGARAALERLITLLEPIGVYAEVITGLNLKWPRPGKRPVNLGYVVNYSAVWTNAVSWFAPDDLTLDYVTEVAKIFGGQVVKNPSGEYAIKKNQKILQLSGMISHIEDWIPAIERFIDAIQKRDQEEEG